jgi:catechol 2,3-dioxygenase-like lactoylglutathione lyase family enzyme
MKNLEANPGQRFMGFDHIDTRVRSLAAVETFYDKLMPLLGFTSKKLSYVDDKGEWNAPGTDGKYNTAEYYAPGRANEAAFFIGFIERADTAPSFTRIAFRVEDVTDPKWMATLRDLGAKNVEPSEDMSAYPAIFFEDPGGTKLEIVSRRPR